MKFAGEIKNPRKKPHLVAALNYLNELGATDIEVTQKGHLHIRWKGAGNPMGITLSCTPKVVEDCAQTARQLIRRQYREHDIPIS